MNEKILVLFMCFISIFCFSSCTQPVIDPVTTPISNASETTTATETTDTTKDFSEETTVYQLYTQIHETNPISTEMAELQEKIDFNYQRNSRNGINNKVILTIGSQRDVPFLRLLMATYWDIGMINEYIPMDPTKSYLEKMTPYCPTYSVNGTETFCLEVNDIAENAPIEVIGEDASIKTYNTIAALCEELESGVYYARMKVNCYGNNIMYPDGQFYMREHVIFYAYFILEIE